MKKIFVLIMLIGLGINTAYADNKDYTVNFNGNKFHLLYSVKDKDFGGYLNEYYKKGETYNIWTEMVAVHHFPNAYSPIDRIKDFKDYLNSIKVPSSLSFDDKKNTAMIDFIMISEHNMPIVMEFNIFKYEKSKKCGSIAIQYAKRYSATTTMQIEAIKKDIEKNRNNLISKIKKFEIPEIITKDIDKCISAGNIIEENKKAEASENAKKQEIVDNIEVSSATVKENNNDDANTEENKIAETEATGSEAKSTEKEGVATGTESETSKAQAIEDTEKNNLEITSSDDKNIQTISNISENINSNEEKITDNIINEQKAEKTDASQAVTTAKTEDAKPEAKPIMAPTYEENNQNTSNISGKKGKNKKIKEEPYEITNDKDKYIAKPRTKKDLKAEIKDKKQKQKEAAKQAKIQAKASKKELKKLTKESKKQEKINKKVEKKAAKAAKKPYTISNNNSELIAKPRTKKELKEANKRHKEILKSKAKAAKKSKKSK